MGSCVSRQSKSSVSEVGTITPSTDELTESTTDSSSRSIKEIITNPIEVDPMFAAGKLITFHNVDVNGDHKCRIFIESDNIEYLILSCYDPICFILKGKYAKNIKTVFIAESPHSTRMRKAFYPNNELERVVTAQDNHTFGWKFIGNFCYYEHLHSKKERNGEIKQIRDKYGVQVIAIIKKHEAPGQLTV